VNQHATIEEAVFSVGTTLRLYNGDLRQLRVRIEGLSGDGSWQMMERSSSRVTREQLVES
jgi:hypothetical protein